MIDALAPILNLPFINHSGGWIFASVLLIIPAIVSVNTLQFYLTQLFRGNLPPKAIIKPLLGNLIVVIITMSVIGYTIYLYFVK